MSITEQLGPFPLPFVSSGSVVFANTALERNTMFHLLDTASEEESLLTAIAETIKAHLETVNTRLSPLLLDFAEFFNEPDVRKKLEPLFEAKYECDKCAFATFAEIETTLVVQGDGNDSLFADFDIEIHLTDDGVDIEVLLPRGVLVKDGDWAEAEAHRLMKELVRQRSFEVREEELQSASEEAMKGQTK